MMTLPVPKENEDEPVIDLMNKLRWSSMMVKYSSSILTPLSMWNSC